MTEYTRIEAREARAGDEILNAGEWVKVERVAFLRQTVKVTFPGGGTKTGPAHHFAFRRAVEADTVDAEDTLECGCPRAIALYADVEPHPACERHGDHDHDPRLCRYCSERYGVPYAGEAVTYRVVDTAPSGARRNLATGLTAKAAAEYRAALVEHGASVGTLTTEDEADKRQFCRVCLENVVPTETVEYADGGRLHFCVVHTTEAAVYRATRDKFEAELKAIDPRAK